MNFISILRNKLKHIFSQNYSQKSVNHLINSYCCTKSFFSSSFHFVLLHGKPFLLHLCYFSTITVFGYFAFKFTKPRTDFNPIDLDLFFTSASATTVSSLTTVEMEVFSNTQLIITTILIFLGSEVFISLIGLQFRRLLMLITSTRSRNHGNSYVEVQIEGVELGAISPNQNSLESGHDETRLLLIYNSIKSLGYIVTGYLLIVLVLGTILIFAYIGLSTSAKRVLENKGLVQLTFYVFTSVSTFTNCGFIPTNENMVVFQKNPGLLLILTPLSLVGGTLYPPCLRLVIWVVERCTKRKEYTFMLENYKELDYGHLKSSIESWSLVGTVFGFLALQFVTFCVMEWSSGVMAGLSSYEKFAGSLFQTASVRHAGESLIDFSIVSSAVLVIFIVMMYFPPYTSVLPIVYQQEEASSQSNDTTKKEHKKYIFQSLLFSNLSFVTIFVILLCFTERRSMKDDPLNFNILSVVFEVVSAYGSVGLSMGYNCKRRLNTVNEICINKSYSLAGWFSKEGKAIIILVMLYGRLKKFNIHGGKTWRLA